MVGVGYDASVPATVSSRVWLAIYAALMTLLLAPFTLVTHPPLQDYPNHLARIFIQLHQDDPVLGAFYRFDWRLVPNLGMELALPLLTSWWSLATAGKLLVAGCLIAMTSAALALHWQLYRRLSVAPLLSLLFVYTLPMQKGFVSFLMASALALWAFVVWRALGRSHPAVRFAATAIMAIALWPVHLYGTGLFAVLVGSTAASEAWRAGGRIRGAVAALAREGLPFVPAAILLFLGPSGGAETNPANMTFRAPQLKPVLLHRLFDHYSLTFDVVLAIGLLWLILTTVRRGGSICHPEMKAPVYALLAVYVALPAGFVNTANADIRVLMPLAMVAAGAMRDPFRGRRAQLRAAAAIILLVCAKTAIVGAVWRDSERVYRDFREIVADVPPGARLAALVIGGSRDDAIFPTSVLHLAGLAVVERKAFVPTLFADPFQHALSYSPEYAPVREGLADSFSTPDNVPWRKIDEEYDYLLLMRPDPSPDGRPFVEAHTHARAVRAQGWFVLFKTPRGELRP
jgi:hypothetical protein